MLCVSIVDLALCVLLSEAIYQLVSEAVEQVSAASQHLCKVMGLPQRERCPAKGSPVTTEDDQLSSTASSSGELQQLDHAFNLVLHAGFKC